MVSSHLKMTFTSVSTLTVVSIVASLQISAEQLICYTCRDYSAQENNTCLNLPTDNTDYYDLCKKKLCYIKRVQFTKTGTLRILERGCVAQVPAGVDQQQDFTTYTRTCNISLCNDWDGITDKYPASAQDDSVITGGVNGDDSIVILSPGQGHSSSLATHVRPPAVCAILTLLLWHVLSLALGL